MKTTMVGFRVSVGVRRRIYKMFNSLNESVLIDLLDAYENNPTNAEKKCIQDIYNVISTYKKTKTN